MEKCVKFAMRDCKKIVQKPRQIGRLAKQKKSLEAKRLIIDTEMDKGEIMRRYHQFGEKCLFDSMEQFWEFVKFSAKSNWLTNKIEILWCKVKGLDESFDVKIDNRGRAQIYHREFQVFNIKEYTQRYKQGN